MSGYDKGTIGKGDNVKRNEFCHKSLHFTPYISPTLLAKDCQPGVLL